MTLANAEFEAILGDNSKRIDGDIAWREDEDHSPSVQFRAEVRSDAGWPLFVCGSYNPRIPALTFVMILKTVGRVYSLDLGKGHTNPDGTGNVGEKHKHKWTEQFRDKWAYVPKDITEPATEPVAVWKQFCTEANLAHNGILLTPQPPSGELFS